MKTKSSNKNHIVYGISLLATCLTLLVLDINFECPLCLSFLPLLGAHALGYAALKRLPHYAFWMPPLTALYLAGWFWMGTYIHPYFMTEVGKTPDFGSVKSTTALWVTSLFFCGLAGMIFLVKKLTEAPDSQETSALEKPAKKPLRISVASRVTVYCLSVALVVTSALCAYFYREGKVSKAEAELVYPTDYTVILPNLQGTTGESASTYSVYLEKEIPNLRNIYTKIKDTSPKDMIMVTQKYAYGKGDLTIATWTLRHKDSTVDPVRDYTVSDVTLNYTTGLGGTTQTVVVTDALRQQVIDIMVGKPMFMTEEPDGLGRGEYPYLHSAYVTVSFADHPEISWRAYVSFTEMGEWFLCVYSIPEDFDINNDWEYEYDFDILYYPMSDGWKTLIGES